MSLELRQIDPNDFVRRALDPSKRVASVLVASDERVDITARRVTDALSRMHVAFTRAELDSKLVKRDQAVATSTGLEAVVITNRSTDVELWKALDRLRTRLEDRTTTLFVLSERAAESFQQNAPNVASLIGASIFAEAASGDEADPPDEALRAAMAHAAAKRYPALYDAKDAREEGDLDETIEELLGALGDPAIDERAWRRIGIVVDALLLEVLPTIAAYWPEANERVAPVRAALDAWLASPRETAPRIPHVEEEPVAPQGLSEALAVVGNASRLMAPAQAREAAAEIASDCLEGFAIIPGSAGRRAIFDWWLHEVLPAAWALRRPARLALPPG